jgi:MoxR-like ATPase
MVWQPYYRGDGVKRDVKLPTPPPWRRFPPKPVTTSFQPPPGLVEAVNAALHLRRPLLLTGRPGSGKSTVIESIAAELGLKKPLRWHITSRSLLTDALYRYDALGRVHEERLYGRDDIAGFLQLGPLGTALLPAELPAERPRALLIDEFDKSDVDLPGDLLEILERGEYEIPELARYREPEVEVRGWDTDDRHTVKKGRVQCSSFPVIVITSNGERDFAAPFLRRCVRFRMPDPDAAFLRQVVTAHLGEPVGGGRTAGMVIKSFVERLEAGDSVALDQLLNAVYLLTGKNAPAQADREALQRLLLQELSRS